MIDILVAQLKKAGPELANNYCIVNGNVLYLNQVENMKLEEYSARSIYSLPNKIYKFFPDTETEDEDGNEVNYSDKALKSNEVYLSSPNDFDDVFDSEITVSWEEFEAFRMKKLVEWSKCSINSESSVEEMAKCFLKRIIEIIQSGEPIETLFYMDEYGEYEKLQSESFILKLKLELLKSEPGVGLRNVIVKEFNNFSESLKNTFRISCFTTEPMSQLMWGGSYANEHRGFCLEYTVLLDREYEEIIHNIKPVFYSKIRRPITQTLLDAYDQNWDDKSLQDLYMNGVLRKSIDWVYQNEWRLILPPQKRGEKGFTKKFFPITKVFLGNRMSAARRKEIIDICKDKGIPYAGVIRSQETFDMKECDTLCENCWRLAEKDAFQR